MGGNALAPFGARRYERGEYMRVRVEIHQLLHKILPKLIWNEIPSYSKKDSFGDMDLLTYPLKPENYETIKQAFGNTPFVRNSEVMSILYENLQVDFIPMEPENFETAYMYYSYNDLGNLMGKLFHKFGLKYGHRGLTMPMKDGDNMYNEIIVSTDGCDIFSFLGLDYDHFDFHGFNNLTEVYDFVISSKYFSTEPFQYENLNHTNRVRDRKRTTYHGFLEYIKDKESKYEFKSDKAEYLPLIFDHFPGVKDQYDEGLKKLEHRLKVKAHFNGDLVKEWTGLEGEKLGQFMAYLKKERGEFAKWVLNYSADLLIETVKLYHYQWVQQLKGA